MYIVGLMSGTSLDGIDAALVRVKNSGLKTVVEMIAFITYPFPKDVEEAVAFALLANETYHGNASNVPNATGAKNAVVLGNVSFPTSDHFFRRK